MTPSPFHRNRSSSRSGGQLPSTGTVLTLLWCYATAGMVFQHVLGSDLEASGPFGIGFLVVLTVGMAAIPAIVMFGALSERIGAVGAAAAGLVAGAGVTAFVVWVAATNTSEVGLLVLAGLVVGVVGAYLKGLEGSKSPVGEVWWVRVPNDDPDEVESHKIRPAVIVESGESGESGPMVLWATSQTKRLGAAGYLDVTDLAGWPADPNGKRSILALRSPYRPSSDDMKSRMGKLPEGSLSLVQTAAANARQGRRGA